jgi:hypothetical protein
VKNKRHENAYNPRACLWNSVPDRSSREPKITKKRDLKSWWNSADSRSSQRTKNNKEKRSKIMMKLRRFPIVAQNQEYQRKEIKNHYETPSLTDRHRKPGITNKWDKKSQRAVANIVHGLARKSTPLTSIDT